MGLATWLSEIKKITMRTKNALGSASKPTWDEACFSSMPDQPKGARFNQKVIQPKGAAFRH